MATSASWTLFDMAEAPPAPIVGHAGLDGRALVDNTDPGGSSLLALRYEPGAGDAHRRHGVGQVTLVVEGELRIDGRPCGPGAGCYAPAGRTYAVEAGPEGAVAVEFRPAPIVYGTGAEDVAEMPVKPPTDADPAYAWDVMQSSGPVTSVHDFSYFDIHTMPEREVSAEMWIQALVNHAEDEGHSMLMVRHAAGNVTPTHSHDVDQIVLVLDGSIKQGSRVFTPGTGFFTPKGRRYMLTAGDEGTVRVEWRPSSLRFATDWAAPRA
ncbi:MAG TPA: cupin domain-containing protein [Acidimicrobiales bacterium]|nr:cupin domain-containing protein [Acidimicrobiales bacterium]